MDENRENLPSKRVEANDVDEQQSMNKLNKNEPGSTRFSLSDGALQLKENKSTMPAPTPTKQQDLHNFYSMIDQNPSCHNKKRLGLNSNTLSPKAKKLKPRPQTEPTKSTFRYLPRTVESRQTFLKLIKTLSKTLSLPPEEAVNYKKLEEKIKEREDAIKSTEEMHKNFEREWNVFFSDGSKSSNEFAFFEIPETNWWFVRPLQMPLKNEGNFHLPAIPEKTYFFFNTENGKFIWNKVPSKEGADMELAPELENSKNGIALLIENEYKHIVCYKEKLLSLVFKLACSTSESPHLAAINELISIGSGCEHSVGVLGALRGI